MLYIKLLFSQFKYDDFRLLEYMLFVDLIILNPRVWNKLTINLKYYKPDPGSETRDTEKSIPNPDHGTRIPDPDAQHFSFYIKGTVSRDFRPSVFYHQNIRPGPLIKGPHCMQIMTPHARSTNDSNGPDSL
jgi:hypothetical protein